MNLSIALLARHNFAAVSTLSKFLESRGYWTTQREIAADVAETVHSLFDSLAWADRRLHQGECWLLEAVLDEDQEHGAHLERAIARGEAPNPVPGCLAAAALHDSVYGTGFAELLLNHLENLGRLIIMADAKITPSELEAYKKHFSHLRNVIAVPGHTQA
ncbi:MAG: hypothetical protein HZC36_11440 [Armatimonadetes bacterium]|nr:hypothetical protein [Armatimonadota bacterium]